jgi:hypothetical protein
MSFDIPQRYEPQIEQVAQEQHITTDEALDRIIQAGLERFVPMTKPPSVSYASLFGAAKNGYGSREAVDRAIAEMRNEW